MNEVSVSVQSVNGIRTKIIKGAQTRYVQQNLDANKMAQLQAQRIRQQEQLKKQKIESFMNNTKLNASKLYKEQCNKNLQQINSKKEILGKQKQVKAKYTVITKKNQPMEEVIKIQKQPIQVNWKQAQDAFKKVHIPVQNCEVMDSSDNQSGYDSQIDKEKNQTPEQVTNNRLKVRKMMLEKLKKQ